MELAIVGIRRSLVCLAGVACFALLVFGFGPVSSADMPKDLFVGEISFTGNTETPDGFLIKEMGLYSGSQLKVDMLQKAQENLKNIGIFEKVSITAVVSDSKYCDVHVSVLEKRSKAQRELSGAWIVKSAMLNGNNRICEVGAKLHFENSTLTLTLGEDNISVFVIIDPGSNPKKIRFAQILSSEKDFALAKGYYDLKADKLRICWRQDGIYPARLDDEGQVLLYLERANASK